MGYKYYFSEADDDLKEKVWNKGKKIIQKEKEYDPDIWRWDVHGSVMKYDEHGNTNSKYGWEIDHKKPKAKGGSDDLDNLQPLQWENNREKSDIYPWP